MTKAKNATASKIQKWRSTGGGEKSIQSTIMLPTLVSVPLYAKKKGVSDNTIKYHINRGNIHVIMIGENQDRYIDWQVYKDFPLNQQE